MFRKSNSPFANRRPLSLQKLDNRMVLAAELSLSVAVGDSDAGLMPGPTLVPSSEVVWDYQITNSGDRAIRGLRVVNDQGSPSDPSDDRVAVAVTKDPSNVNLADGGTLLATFEDLNIGKMIVDPIRSRLFATVVDEAELIVFDTENSAKGRSVNLPATPTGLTLSQDGSRLFVSAYDEGDDEGVIVILNASTLDEIDIIDIDGQPQDVEIGADGRLIVLTDSQLLQLDPVSGEMVATSLSIGHSRGELAISPLRDRLYVASLKATTASLMQVDITADPPTVLWQSPGGVLTGSNGQDLAISHDGQHVSYAAGNGQSGYQIARYDTEASAGSALMNIAGYYVTGAFPREVTYSPDDAVVYTASRLGHIGRFDVDTFDLIGEWNVVGNVRELMVDTTGRFLYAAFDEELRIYSTGRSVAVNTGDDNDNQLLDPGETWSYTSQSLADIGSIESTVFASGIDSLGQPLNVTETAYYTGESTSVIWGTTLQGQIVEPNTSRSFPVDEPLVWRHSVSNTGSTDLTNVLVQLNGSEDLTDRYLAGDTNDDGILASGETWVYEVRANTAAGLQSHDVSLAADVVTTNNTITESASYPYFGVDARIETQSRINGVAATIAPGREVGVGDPATLVYEVSNSGNVPLLNLRVTENRGTIRADDDFSPARLEGDFNSNEELDPGETWLYLIEQSSIAGIHQRQLSVTGTDTLGRQIDALSTAHYVGVGGNVNLSVNLLDASGSVDSMTVVPVGELVRIQFLVTNAGTLTLGIPNVSADPGTPDNPNDDLILFRVNEDSGADGVLSPGEIWDYRVIANAIEGLSRYSANVIAPVVDSLGAPLPGVNAVSASDVVEYFGGFSSLSNQVLTSSVPIPTQSDDSNQANRFLVDSSVQWKYEVTNTGNLPLQDVSVEVIDELENSLAVFPQTPTLATGLDPRGTVLAEIDNASIHEFVAHPSLPYVFASDTIGNRVLMFNTDSLEVEATFQMGSGPRGMALSPDGNRLFVTHANSQSIGVLDVSSQTVLSNLQIAQIPRDIEVGLDGRLFVLGNSALMQLDPENGESVGVPFPVFVSEGEIAINPERTRLYYSNANQNPASLYQIDLTGSTSTILWESPSDPSRGGNAQALALSPAGDLVAHAVAIQGSDLGQTQVKIVVRDTSDMSVAGEYNLGPKTTGVFAQEITFDPDGRFVYATSQAGAVSIFGASTFAQTSSMSVQGTATEMLVDSTGRFLFTSANGQMTVISTGRASSSINRGDVDFDRQFDPGETWFYQSSSIVQPGSGRHQVQSSATSSLIGIVQSETESSFLGSHRGSVDANVLGANAYQESGLQTDWILSDDRFEIAGDLLRLKAGQFLTADDDGIEVQLRENESDVDVLRSVVVRVNNIPAWQNSVLPEDVNNDQVITALDALILINRMNENQTGTLGPRPVDVEAFYDVTGDGSLTAIDALRVINALNGTSAGNGSAEPLQDDSLLVDSIKPTSPFGYLDDSDSKKRLAWLDQWFATF